MPDCIPTASGFTAVGVFFLVVLSMWAGDYLGRKFPTQWSALRAGLKKGGGKLRDAFRDEE